MTVMSGRRTALRAATAISAALLMVALLTSCSRGGSNEGAASSPAAASAWHVDRDRCIGCGRCAARYPEAFELDPTTGKARIKPGAKEEDLAGAAQICPVQAISRTEGR